MIKLINRLADLYVNRLEERQEFKKQWHHLKILLRNDKKELLYYRKYKKSWEIKAWRILICRVESRERSEQLIADMSSQIRAKLQRGISLERAVELEMEIINNSY